LDPQQLSYEHYNESAHLSKRHRTSAIDDDSLYSTNNWGFENPEVEHFNPDYSLATNPTPNHSARYPSTLHDAIGFGYDDSANHGGVGPIIPLHESRVKLAVGYGDSLPLLSGFENTSLSTSTFGNLESVSNTHVDVNASFDYGNGQYDFSGFSFDDYLISIPDFVSTIGGVEVEHASSPSSSTHQFLQAQSSPNSSLSPSSLGSESSEGRVTSPGSLASSAGSSVNPLNAKMEITAVLSFECSGCHRTFTCESRYKSHRASPCKFSCTFQGCDKQFSEARSVQRHISADHLGVTFNCASCGKIFKRNDKYTSHQRSCNSAAKAGAKDTAPVKKRKRVE